ncbi:ethanolamine ammonia-lyase small subunit [Pseudomonas syringae pv. actinidiae ICMP 19096]|uniref:Ethanolamine ammonia-lyase small subunit n=1 Tax=Pseudomonas syringae pv. actinidiae ICMP 19096 TaxID=1194405 RepID=A0A656K2P0_PSESF|nr:ethanolamine ammonia-lyase small subunit [Pseudomonas syringae pv. actinidiae ICMP 19096]
MLEYRSSKEDHYDLAIVVADGFSALAIQRHTLPFLKRLYGDVSAEGWKLAPVCIVQQGRVAVADEVGELLGAKMSLILVGERPRLNSPDSLGLYFTYGPNVGLTDASHNCISNVRLEGMAYGNAAFRLMYLMTEACRCQLSGVDLKDETEIPSVGASGNGNFLLGCANNA